MRNLPLSGQTFKFLHSMDQRSTHLGFSYCAKCNGWGRRDDFPKRRLARKSLEGECGLANEYREAGGLTHEDGAFQ